jgi:RNA polymerase sigma-70 factor (ECF subfamily)
MGESALACAEVSGDEGSEGPDTLSMSSPVATPAADAGGAVDQVRMVAVVTRHFDFIWRSLRRLGIAEDGVDDAAQEVFIVASRKIGLVLPKGERSFLFAIALRIAADARRTRRRHPDHGHREDLVDLADGTPAPDELLDRSRARALLDKMIEDLPLDVRAVFVLYEMEELSMAQIAELLHLPAGTVASRLRRGRELFRIALERYRLQTDRGGVR